LKACDSRIGASETARRGQLDALFAVWEMKEKIFHETRGMDPAGFFKYIDGLAEEIAKNPNTTLIGH
jgi:hypothetical protein